MLQWSPCRAEHRMKEPRDAIHPKPKTSEARREFYARLDKKNTAPLWEVLGALIPAEPQPACGPAPWKYSELRPLLMEGAGLTVSLESTADAVLFSFSDRPAQKALGY